MDTNFIKLYFTKEELEDVMAVLIQSMPMVGDVNMRARLNSTISYMHQHLPEVELNVQPQTVEEKENTDVQ